MADLAPYRKGDQFRSGWLNGLLDAIRSCMLKSDGSILVTRTPDGQLVRVNLPQEVDARISGGANPYSAVEQRAVGSGAWADLAGGRTFAIGVDPLYERNRNPAVTAGTYVRARRDISTSAWIFDRGACTTTGGVATTTTTAPAPAPAPGPAPNPAPNPAPTQTPPIVILSGSAPAANSFTNPRPLATSSGGITSSFLTDPHAGGGGPGPGPGGGVP